MVRFHWNQIYMGEIKWEINRKEGSNAQRRTHSHSDCSQATETDGKHSTAKCLLLYTDRRRTFKRRSLFSYTGFMDKRKAVFLKDQLVIKVFTPVNSITLTAEQNICVFIALNSISKLLYPFTWSKTLFYIQQQIHYNW